jgi:DNA-binding CsgD family transcriptional regulator/tetratricopeptide (TPR) repeat protein
LDDQDPAHAELSAEAVSLLAGAGRLVEAQAAGEAALAGNLDGPTQARALLGLAEAFKHAGLNAAAARYARRGLDCAGVPDTVQARLHAVAAHALLWDEDPAGADEAGIAAERTGVPAGDFAAAVFGRAARSVVAMAHGDLARSLAHAERAVELADEARGEAAQRHPRIWLGNALAAVDRIADARAAWATGRQEAERLGTAWSMPLWHCFDAQAQMALGDLDGAAAEAEAGLLIASQLTARQMSMPLLSLLTAIEVWRDDLPAARRRRQQMHDLTGAGITTAVEDVAWAAALVHDAEGQPGLAVKDLADVYDRMPGRLFLLATNPGCAAELVRMAIDAGEQERAGRAVTAIRTIADQNPTVASLAGAAAHAQGVLTGDIDAYREAVRHLRGSPRRLDLACAMDDGGRAEIHHGDRTLGVELLTAAVSEFAACGARRRIGPLERVLAELGVRGRRRATETGSPLSRLTPTERRVATKVAEGCTNREVGEALRMSRHTVDTHLRGAFRKLGVNSRVELTVLLLREERPNIP